MIVVLDPMRSGCCCAGSDVLPIPALLLLAALLLLFQQQQWRLWLVRLLIAMSGPLVFANLYFVHDYYFYASGALFLVLVALPHG